MQTKKIRAISRGSVIWISEATAKNADFLKKYKITIDDASFQPVEATVVQREVIPAELPEVEDMIEEREETDVESLDDEPSEEKPKRTRKPKTEE
jgi:hypothetical protein